METATAAVGSVLSKLQAYLSNNHKEDHCGDVVERLAHELGGIHAALLDGASAQAHLHDEPAMAWAGEAREMAYDVEDALDDALLVASSPAGDDGDPARVTRGSLSHSFEGLLQIATDLSRARPQIQAGVPTPVAAVDHPRELPPPDGEAVLVGVDDARDGLIRRLRLRDEAGRNNDDDGDDKVKVASVVGPVGLGKTTLAVAAYGVLEPRFDCAASVSVGIDPDIPEVLESALRQLGVTQEDGDGYEQRDEGQLTSQLREFLQNKRYLVVLDDLWDKSSWEKVRRALADNSLGSRTVTTTRDIGLADEIGATYELKPLSHENSKTLLFRTVFGGEEEDKRPGDDEFTEAADKILEKCGGLPLAIITLGKLLAGKTAGVDKGEWRRVGESIGPTLENTPEVESMRAAVSRSYYNLPPHLRACLLYTSVFPENGEVRRDRLVWRWIAEGFVRAGDGEEEEESLFELGLAYFDELVNRGVVRFLDIDFSEDGSRYEYCFSVTFPVMDFVRCLSSQEGFVAVLGGERCASPSPDVRRVSIRGGGTGSKAEDSASLGSNTAQLRSLTVLGPATFQKIIDLKACKFLRVLDLEGCDLSSSQHLLHEHLRSLVHLRYLGLRETRIASVHEQIGDLRFLQTLDLEENLNLEELPASVARLGPSLACLRVYWRTRLPRGLGNLTALEELSDATTRGSPDLVAEDLRGLTRLRTLRVTLWKPATQEGDALVESLRGLRALRTLDVYVAGGDGSETLDLARGDDCQRRLVEFRAGAADTCRTPLRRLPPWLTGSATVPLLAVVVVKVTELRQRDLDALGALPALRVLSVEPYAAEEPLHVSGDGAPSFPRLTELRFRNADVAPVFRRGAAPRLRRLELCFRVRRTVDLGNARFEFGLENLPCLEEVTVSVACQEAWEHETDAAEAALRRAADLHPNRAAFDVITFGEELMCFDD